MEALGRRFRALRAASGRTVASVATDAGLSVPYVANLENGRGNPTLGALDRLAGALGAILTIDLGDRERDLATDAPTAPAALVRLARTARFRHVAAVLAGSDRDPADVAAALVDVLARIGPALAVDPDDVDWFRILDALTLVGLHPHADRAP